MITADIRRQGNTTIITIPNDILRAINVDIGATVEIHPTNDGFYVRKPSRKARRRYSLQELMRGVTEDFARDLNEETSWSREGIPMGRELA
jgi:antitoxin component of MazEF toxin-antitoxin module